MVNKVAHPLVSVIMPCYNGAAYIEAAILSVLEQSYPNIELIIVNDGSTDHSLQVITPYLEQVKCITQENQGVSCARNHGVAHASGAYIAFLDSDDYWSVDFVSEMVAAMADPEVAIAYCGWQNVGKKLGEPFIPANYETDEKLAKLLAFACLWPIHGAMIRASMLPPNEPFNPSLRACEDYDLWLRIACFHPIRLVPKVLAFYRHHHSGQSTSDQAMIARYNLWVKNQFLAENPSIKAAFSASQVKQFCAGAFMQRGYRCLWQGDLTSAYGIFRYALLHGLLALKDLKYALPTLLPVSWYCRLLKGRGLGTAQSATK